MRRLVTRERELWQRSPGLAKEDRQRDEQHPECGEGDADLHDLVLRDEVRREALEDRLELAPGRTIYVGDGSSDVHVMLHVNSRDGFTIAVSENTQLARIARSTVLSDNAFSVMVPILDQVLGWNSGDIRALFESNGLTLHEWEKARTDRVTVRSVPVVAVNAVAL